jgi:hypothetical protein
MLTLSLAPLFVTLSVRQLYLLAGRLCQPVQALALCDLKVRENCVPLVEKGEGG